MLLGAGLPVRNGGILFLCVLSVHDGRSVGLLRALFWGCAHTRASVPCSAAEMAQHSGKKNAELLHLEVIDLRKDNVYLSTILEEVGTLLWAACQQLERPYEAVQSLLDALGIAAHAMDEGKLHAEVLTMLLSVAQQGTRALAEQIGGMQKGEVVEEAKPEPLPTPVKQPQAPEPPVQQVRGQCGRASARFVLCVSWRGPVPGT